MKDLDWNLLKSFIYVVREGSLSAAARALNSTQPTVGRHIEALEVELGMPLFMRSRDGVVPTEDALNLLPELQAMLGSYSAFERKISGESFEDVGTVRLAVSEVMGVEVLPNILIKFHKQNPNIKIELTISNKTVNLLKRDADLAIRMSNPKQDPLISKYIGESPVGLFCHKSYLKLHGIPTSLIALKNHKIIGPDEDLIFLETLKSCGLDLTREDIYFRTDNQIAQLNLIRSALGIGVMQIQLAKKEKNLIQILEKELSITIPIWVVMHEDLKSSKKIRTLFNFLIEEMNNFIN